MQTKEPNSGHWVLKPTPEQVKYNRLERKYNRLMSRFLKSENLLSMHATFMGMYPNIRASSDSFFEKRAERERVRALEQRVREQESLINFMENELNKGKQIK